ncbi:MAG: sarcosine oxidase subunit alpha family protein [Ideonella sp.]
MSQPSRVEGGSFIDRDKALSFTFNGRTCSGFDGDTLASALLANGVRMLGRSFKYHRPRGIVALGSEEPNALLRVMDRDGNGWPNGRATTIPLLDGMAVRSQHHWPSLDLDLGALADCFSRFLSTGFYYKTFMWPRRWWPHYEHILRHAAGLGAPPTALIHPPAGQRHVHVDVLVVGGGPAGLAAALAAGRSGASVLLAEDDARLGGSMPEDEPGDAESWLLATLAALREMPNVSLLTRTVATGYYDHDFLTMVQTRLKPTAQSTTTAHTLWKVRATRVVLATGAIERPLVFGGNDRPGVMLASAVIGYLQRYGVLCGRRIVLCTNNDSVYVAVPALERAGATIEAVLDVRDQPSAIALAAIKAGLKVISNASIVGTDGRARIRAVRWTQSSGATMRTECDLLAMAGGWTPRVHLFSQARGTLRYEPSIGSFVPRAANGANVSAGACNGCFDTDACIAEGERAGRNAAPIPGASPGIELAGTTEVATPSRQKAFVDFQNDVTVGDILMASREGYRSVEHLKRYTTLGMGTDQGKLSNINGLAILASQTGQAPGQVGTTTFRPPYIPIDLSVIAGLAQNHPAHAVRRLATHDWHLQNGAVFTPSGIWLRPQLYRRPGESDLDAVNREVGAVRDGVGLIDVSPLGKIELQGTDAAELLNRLYVNRFNKLPIGRAKFGVILREDGMVLDDSVVARLSEYHFVMSTSTAHSKLVPEHIAFCLHTIWPTLRVHVTPVSEQWSTFALAGRLARAVLSRLSPDFDVSAAALPHMSVRVGTLAGATARVARMSFSGELSYEISVPAAQGMRVWTALVEAGAPHGLTVYGTEAMGVLRIEKGHFVVGREASGTATLDDLGLGGLLDRSKDCIGMRSLSLPALAEAGRAQLIGVKATEPGSRIPPGAHIVLDNSTKVQHSHGAMTSQCYSPTLGCSIGLAMVQSGRARVGEIVYAVSPVTNEAVRVQLTDARFVDPAGERLNA